jgi:hypothetical protein
MIRFIFAAVLAGLAIAQPLDLVVAGKATAVAGDQLTVQSGNVSTLLTCTGTSNIWRGKMGHSLAAIQVGDEISARYRRDGSGRLVIGDLWANIDHVEGLITAVSNRRFTVDENYGYEDDPKSHRGSRQITFDTDTEWQGSAPEDLRVGRQVDIIGLKTGPLDVQATRITVYENKRPVRMRPDARIIGPNGHVVEPK